MKVFLRILAMILLVVPTQNLVRGILSGFWGHGYNFATFGLSNTMVIIISIILISLSLFLFHITEPFIDKVKKE